MPSLPYDLTTSPDPIEQHQRSQRVTKRDGIYTMILFVVMLSVLWMFFTKADKTDAPIVTDDSLKQVESVVVSNKEINSSQQQAIDALIVEYEALKQSYQLLNKNDDAVALVSQDQQTQIKAIQSRLDKLEADVKQQADAVTKTQAQAPKAEKSKPAATPKPRRIVPRQNFSIASIKQYGRQSVVALTLNGKQSPNLRTGDRWMGWTVKSIDGRSAVLTRYGRNLTVAI